MGTTCLALTVASWLRTVERHGAAGVTARGNRGMEQCSCQVRKDMS